MIGRLQEVILVLMTNTGSYWVNTGIDPLLCILYYKNRQTTAQITNGLIAEGKNNNVLTGT